VPKYRDVFDLAPSPIAFNASFEANLRAAIVDSNNRCREQADSSFGRSRELPQCVGRTSEREGQRRPGRDYLRVAEAELPGVPPDKLREVRQNNSRHVAAERLSKGEFIRRLLSDFGELSIARGRATNYRVFRACLGAVSWLGCSQNLNRAAAGADFYNGAGGGFGDAAPRADCGLDG
jgi:hypothetical protein